MKKILFGVLFGVVVVVLTGCGIGTNQTVTPTPTTTAMQPQPTAVSPTAVPPTAVPPTAVQPTAVNCASQTRKIFFGDDPRTMEGVTVSPDYLSGKFSNLYETSEAEWFPAADCPQSGAIITFNDVNLATGQGLCPDTVLALPANAMIGFQGKYKLCTGKFFASHGQKATFGPGCLVLWQHDQDDQRGLGWRVTIVNGKCNAPAPAPTAIAVEPTRPVCPNQWVGIDLSVKPSANAGLVATKPTNFPQSNMYEASQVRFVAAKGCENQKATVVFQDWEPIGGGQWQQNGPDFNLVLKSGSDVNLQKLFFPATTTMLSDHGQKIILPPGCIELWQNDVDAPGGRDSGWYVKFCNQIDP